MAEAPSALILGGCGFVGRNLVQHLVEKKLCSKIKVVDRTMPAMAFLSDVHKAAFASVEGVEYMAAVRLGSTAKSLLRSMSEARQQRMLRVILPLPASGDDVAGGAVDEP